MRTRFTTTLLLAAVLGLAGMDAAWAKKPVDKFAAFKGKFSGSASFVVSMGSPAVAGSGTITVSGPKNGKSLQLVFAGLISSGGITAPYSNVITIAKAGSVQVADGIFTLGGSSSAPVSGSAGITKKAITGTGSFNLGGDPASITFTIRSKTVGKKRTLTIDYVLTNLSGSYPFQFVATGKVKE